MFEATASIISMIMAEIVMMYLIFTTPPKKVASTDDDVEMIKELV
jgi:hypothetical protein